MIKLKENGKLDVSRLEIQKPLSKDLIAEYDHVAHGRNINNAVASSLK